MYDIAGKVALVTGAGGGIGKAYSAALVEQGAKVVLVDMSDTLGKAVEKELNSMTPGSSHFICCDITDPVALKACFDGAISNFGKLDIIINNAGTLDETEEGWRKTVELNLMSVIESCRLAVKMLKPGGVIINTSSIASYREASVPIYAATKGGVTTFSRSLGSPRTFEVTKIRVLTVQPGLTETELARNSSSGGRKWLKVPPTDRKLVLSQTPEKVAECMMDALRNGKTGSVYTVFGGKWSHEECGPTLDGRLD